MKIGIFGGTFDPFTPAHKEIVIQALSTKIVDFVLIIPTAVTYYRKDKKDIALEPLERIKLINKVFENSEFKDFIYVDAWELRNAKTDHRFIDTMKYVIDCYSKNGENEFYTIIGTDSFNNLKTWTKWEELVKLTKFIVIPGRNSEQIIITDISYIQLQIAKKYLNFSASKMRLKYMKDNKFDIICYFFTEFKQNCF